MICKLNGDDFQDILIVVNDAAIVYEGKIPADRWKMPYMTAQELKEEIQSGVEFFGWKENKILVAVMGIQRVNDVTLIRHAYTLTSRQRKGLGEKLLEHLLKLADTNEGLRGNLGSCRLGDKILSKTRIRTSFNRGKE